jgi:hypothetical protein
MTFGRKDSIADLLIASIPRDLLMGVEDALLAGAMRGFTASKGMDEGHLPTVMGQMRSFHMNEAFNEALRVAGGNPTPIRGNSIVVGRVGVFKLSRFNISAGVWNNGRRSRTRRQMSEANRAIEQLVQPSLFDIEPITAATAFFVACFSGSVRVQPESPQAIHIAVPDREMKGWLFKEPLSTFISRYDVAPQQDDIAVPMLKKDIIERGQDEKS